MDEKERMKILIKQLKLTQEKVLSDFNTVTFNKKEFEFLMFKLISGLTFSFLNATSIDKTRLLLSVNEEVIKMIDYFKNEKNKVKSKGKK